MFERESLAVVPVKNSLDVFSDFSLNGFSTLFDAVTSAKYPDYEYVDDTLVISMPGFSKENISVFEEDNTLKVSAKETHAITKKEKSFASAFKLSSMTVDKIEYINGELIIHLKHLDNKKERIALPIN